MLSSMQRDLLTIIIIGQPMGYRSLRHHVLAPRPISLEHWRDGPDVTQRFSGTQE
jgi:hypothetical protein